MTSILRLASRTSTRRRLHATDASLTLVGPTQVESEGERNPKKVGPCIDMIENAE